MASAYHIFQNWKLDQISMTDFPLSSSGGIRAHLQLLSQNEVCTLLSLNFELNYSLNIVLR
jgi:hypothetical protein